MLIEGNPILLKGDRFKMNWVAWYRLVTLSTDPLVAVPTQITVEVQRIYSNGTRILYICRAVAGYEEFGRNLGQIEFVLESEVGG